MARSRDRDGARPGLRGGRPRPGLDSFSGGELTRASLARALATGADVLLLDEPTNHLDIESLEWLEQTLVELDAAVVLVAHDRWFLEAVGTAVLELEAGRSRFFAGTWHQWRRSRPRARSRWAGRSTRSGPRSRAWNGSSSASATRPRRRARRSRASRSSPRSSASSAIPRPAGAWSSRSPPPERSGRVIFELLDGRIEVGGEKRGSRHRCSKRRAVAGARRARVAGEANGTGRATLIEALAGRRELAAGKLSTGHNVKIGYLSQHAEELGAGGAPGQSVLDAAQRATRTDAGQGARAARALPVLRRGRREAARGALGRRAPRLSLAILVHSGANVLILDEPTNHLDIESREALEDALRAFTGAVLLVSHDRAAARRGRHAHDRRRGGLAAQLRRRLARVRARARRAPPRRPAERRRLAPGRWRRAEPWPPSSRPNGSGARRRLDRGHQRG